MKILFHLGHPAHFHLFKNIIDKLKAADNEILIVIKKKDVLEELLSKSNYNYTNILPSGRKNNIIGLSVGQITQDIKLYKFCKKQRPDLLIGTSVAISHVGQLLNIPSLNFNEDDAKVVPLYSYLAYPMATRIISPDICNNSFWQNKTNSYNGYHELAYLHPKYFIPNKNIVEKYFPTKIPYFILRFAQLSAHHDKGITGITYDIANKLISLLKLHGNIYISSERELESDFEQYILNIDPLDIHHVLAFAKMYIGDSQTMAAEAAVLGTPSIRYNDFVGELGYLEELEHKYCLTYGFKTSKPETLFKKIEELLKIPSLTEEWQNRQKKMLKDKIDVTAFIVWFIENYPNSTKIMKKYPEYQYNLK